MKMPIVVDEHGDLMTFSSLEEACSYIEPIDVKNSEYVAHDAEGNLLSLDIKEVEKPALLGLGKKTQEEVSITEPTDKNESDVLKRKILDYLQQVKVTDVDNDSGLDALVNRLDSFLSSK